MKKKLILYSIILMLMIYGCGNKQKNTTIVDNIGIVELEKGTFGVDNSKSSIVWTGKKLSTKEHTGTLDIKVGEIRIDENGNIVGEIEIDMLSINTIDIQGKSKDRLDGHLKSLDFFDVVQFPSAFLKFNGNKDQLLDGKLDLNGELTIKNINHPITFHSELNKIDGNLSAKAKISFDRTKYDVKYGSGKFFENLGDRLILDEISVDVFITTN